MQPSENIKNKKNWDNDTLLVNTVAVPLQIGHYREGQCLQRHLVDGRTSDVLLQYLETLLDNNPIGQIVYVNGPGSYMAIKLTYIALKTVEMIRGIPFYGCSAFELNGGQPVRAMGHLYFVKEKETIMTRKFPDKMTQEFGIPDDVSLLSLEEENRPHYILPAV